MSEASWIAFPERPYGPGNGTDNPETPETTREVQSLHSDMSFHRAHTWERCLLPKLQPRRAECHERPKARLLDHLVGALLEKPGHIEAERLCGLEVYRQLVLVRRLHREVGRLLTFKNTVDVIGRLPVLIDQIGAGMGPHQADQPASTRMVMPCTASESDEARNTAVPVNSSGSRKARPVGVRLRICST